MGTKTLVDSSKYQFFKLKYLMTPTTLSWRFRQGSIKTKENILQKKNFEIPHPKLVPRMLSHCINVRKHKILTKIEGKESIFFSSKNWPRAGLEVKNYLNFLMLVTPPLKSKLRLTMLAMFKAVR